MNGLRVAGLVAASSAALVAVACAKPVDRPPGPVVSPTGISFDAGVPPVETRYSQTASLYLRSNRPERTLDLAQDGIAAEPSNPIHWYLAGLALVRMDRYLEADSMLAEAQRRYPAYELQVEPVREAAWADAFNRGAEAYRAGRPGDALVAWSAAAAISDLRPEAHVNLAALYHDAGRHDEAIELYRRALEGLDRRPVSRVLDDDAVRRREADRDRTEERLVELLLVTGRGAQAESILRQRLERYPDNVPVRQQLAAALVASGSSDEARAVYGALLVDGRLDGPGLFSVGVALFRLEDYPVAATAFRRLTELRPHSRDAWFNYANSLFAAGDWQALAQVGDRLVELDPLNENAALITARAYLELGDEAAARERLDRIEAAPVHVDALAARTLPAGTGIQGRIIGNRSETGRHVRLRFVFYDDRDELGSEVVDVEAPPPGESRAFDVLYPARVIAYRYELIP